MSVYPHIWSEPKDGNRKTRKGGELSPPFPSDYSFQTFFILTEAVGWSLKFMTFFRMGQITVE